MMERIMMVIGDCDPQAFSSVQFSVNEKLTPQEETGILYITADEISDRTAATHAVNQLLENVNPNSALDRRNVSIVVLYDRNIDKIQELTRILRNFEEIRSTIGIWRFSVHLIWFIDEFPGLRYTYSEMLEQFIRDKDIYKNIYVLSDRHSDLGHGRDKRLNGAANLISALLHGRPLEGGLYSLGVGKMNITSFEMREYAKHKAREALKSQLLRWGGYPSLDDICASSFSDDIENADQFPDWLSRLIESRLMTTFAYAKGEYSICSDVGEPVSNDFSELFREWYDNLEYYIRKIPFTEQVKDYFEENSSFQDFQSKIEQQIFAKAVESVEPGFLASSLKREVIKNYNTFIQKEQEVVREGLAAFMQQWNSYLPRIRELASEQILERDRILQAYQRDEQFVQLCESVAGVTTGSIQNALAKLIISQDQYNAFPDDIFTDEKAAAMMKWIAEQTCRNATPRTIMEKLKDIDPGVLVKDVIDPMISESKVYFACPADTNLPDPTSSYLFIPSKLFGSGLPGLAGVNVVPITAEEYQNIEYISMIRIGDTDRMMEGAAWLTAFRGEADPSLWDSPKKKEGPVPAGDFFHSNSEDTESEESQAEKDNPWEISVQAGFSGYQATFNWDGGIEKLALHVKGEDGPGGSMNLTKSNFLLQGYVNIDDIVSFGKHTITLVSAGKEISRCDFEGRKHRIEVETEKSDFRLSKDILLQQVDLRIVSVDGNGDASLTSDVCGGLSLLLDRKDQLILPQPWVKHKKQGWIVIMEDKVFEPMIVGPYASTYELHIV